MKGIIKKWFRFRGFGFIEPDEEVFSHRSEIKYEVEPLEGQKVQFTMVPNWKGPARTRLRSRTLIPLRGGSPLFDVTQNDQPVPLLVFAM